jgi:F-type H+-transporting ATPase subunit b
MHIDWFVFLAQIVNFLILFTLLKKFLYGRIIGAMDAREARISETFSEAEKTRQEAYQDAAVCEKRLKELEHTADELLNKARMDADAYRKELMEKARQEVDLMQARWIEALHSERENILQELRRLTGTQVYAITRKVLKDLADLDLEQRIVRVLAQRIEAMDRGEREKIRSLTVGGEKITLLSAFDIPSEVRETLAHTIHRDIGPDIDVAYEKTNDLLSGYEFRIDGYKIAWSMKDYMDTLEEKFHLLLYRESQEKM